MPSPQTVSRSLHELLNSPRMLVPYMCQASPCGHAILTFVYTRFDSFPHVPS